jgi:hypothetical protein
MKNYLQLWCKDLLSLPQTTLASAVTVSGFHKHHFGARQQQATVVVELCPAKCLSVNLGQYQFNVEHSELAEATVMGIIDVLLTSGMLPIGNVLIKVIELQIDPLLATANAFRMAGRDAARKAITINEQKQQMGSDTN